MPAAHAVDGNPGTRWSSTFSDPQWIQRRPRRDRHHHPGHAQLGGRVRPLLPDPDLRPTARPGPPIYSTTTGAGGIQSHPGDRLRPLRADARHRARHGYGYSLWEFQVHGTFGGDRTRTAAARTNAAQGRPATASSTENAGTPAGAAVDGNAGTRWSSAVQPTRSGSASTSARTQTHLPGRAPVGGARTPAPSRSRRRNNGTTWTTDLLAPRPAPAARRRSTSTGSGRYVRMNGTVRATGYGYSLWEFRIYTGTGGPTSRPTTPDPDPTPSDPVEPTDPRNPNLGPNTYVFDPSTPTVDHPEPAQHHLHPAGDQPVRPAAVRRAVQARHLHRRRQPRLLHPGRRPRHSRRTTSTSTGTCASRRSGSAATPPRTSGAPPRTCRVTLPAGVSVERWAVSQAAPYRRMHLRGGGNQSSSGTAATAGPAAASWPTPRSTARSSPARSSSGTPATASSAAGPARSGTWCSRA